MGTGTGVSEVADNPGSGPTLRSGPGFVVLDRLGEVAFALNTFVGGSLVPALGYGIVGDGHRRREHDLGQCPVLFVDDQQTLVVDLGPAVENGQQGRQPSDGRRLLGLDQPRVLIVVVSQ